MPTILSPHFTLEELTASTTASRRGIDNTPPPDSLEALKVLATTILEPIRTAVKVPIRIESGYRSSELNRIVGGQAASQHQALLGKEAAADLVAWPRLTAAQLASAILRIPGLQFDQLIVEYHNPEQPQSGWVHVSCAVGRAPRKMVLTIDRHGVRTGIDSKT